MKETVLEILVDLFENDPEHEHERAVSDGERLRSELEHAGLSQREVSDALTWLERLRAGPEPAGMMPTPRSTRVFAKAEQLRLDIDCRGYILYLENAGILSAPQRELVIDRLLALDMREVGIEQAKWVALMALASQFGEARPSFTMEDLIFDSRSEAVLH